jgi:hypothetical protein
MRGALVEYVVNKDVPVVVGDYGWIGGGVGSPRSSVIYCPDQFAGSVVATDLMSHLEVM